MSTPPILVLLASIDRVFVPNTVRRTYSSVAHSVRVGSAPSLNVVFKDNTLRLLYLDRVIA